MKFCVLLVGLLFARTSFGAEKPGFAPGWVNDFNVAFNHGPSDMYNASNVWDHRPADQFAMLVYPDCAQSEFQRLYAKDQYGLMLDVVFLESQQDQRGRWDFYRFMVIPQSLSMLGLKVFNYGNVCHTEWWHRLYSQPTPPPPGPGIPLMKHCEKVAFDLKYEFDMDIEQAVAVAATNYAPCSVHVWFAGVMGYRNFVDVRQRQGKGVDFDILQPENVKVLLQETTN